jgi:hypothetical protein
MRALDQTSDGDHLVIEAAMEFASGDDMSAEMIVALHQWFGGFGTTFYISKLHIEGKVCVHHEGIFLVETASILNSATIPFLFQFNICGCLL